MKNLLKKPWFASLCAVICTALWGSAYPVIKYSYAQLDIASVADKLVFAGVRFVLAGLTVFIAAWIRRRAVPTVERRKIGGIILYGAVQTGLMYILNYIGVAHTSATKTSILTAASAFFAVLFAPLFFRGERLTARKLVGVIVGFGGIIAVNASGLDGGFSFSGEGLVLIATLLNTAGSFIGKRVAKGRVFEATAYQLMIGGALILLAAEPMGGGFVLSAQSLLLTLYLAFVSAAAFSLWTALLTVHEAGRILVFNLLIPVFGAVWSFIILGERQIFDPMYLVSAALITVGIFLVNYHKKFPKPLSFFE